MVCRRARARPVHPVQVAIGHGGSGRVEGQSSCIKKDCPACATAPTLVAGPGGNRGSAAWTCRSVVTSRKPGATRLVSQNDGRILNAEAPAHHLRGFRHNADSEVA